MFLDKYEKENKEKLEGLSFLHDGKRKLFYRFIPSKTNPVGSPLLIILHGHGTSAATKFKRDGWNILVPVDHFGNLDKKGCWWLGENGDFFVKELLQKLIQLITKEYHCEENIYFYGSSMGGFGAILHGTLCNARAVYANVPQIKLLGTTYSEKIMKKYFAPIFSDEIPKENDLTYLLEKDKNPNHYPTFYICENAISRQSGYKNYAKEHAKYFIEKCEKYTIKYHLELLPKSGHDKNYGIGEVLDKFEKFTPPLEHNNIVYKDNTQPIEYVKFEENLWFLSNVKTIENITFNTNKVNISLSNKENVFYLIFGDKQINALKIKKLFVLKENKSFLKLNFNVKNSDKVNLTCYVQYYDDTQQIFSESHRTKEGANKIHLKKPLQAKYLKLLFRVSHTKKSELELSGLSVVL